MFSEEDDHPLDSNFGRLLVRLLAAGLMFPICYWILLILGLGAEDTFL